MTKTKPTHTPGPLTALRWGKLEGRRRVFTPRSDYVLMTADGQITSVCASAFGVEQLIPEGIDAKLALLIIAAPAMYDFVRRLADQVCYEEPGEFPEKGESGHAPCLTCQARAAIARAEEVS